MLTEMSPTTEDILRQYVSRTGLMHETLGLPRIHGEVAALLYLHEQPLDQDEIAEFLQVSKGSVSTNLQGLERAKFVKKVRIPGKRKDHYEFAGDMWSSVKEAFDAFIRNEVEDFKKLNKVNGPLLEAEAAKGGSDKVQLKHMATQIKNLNGLYKFLDVISSLTTLFRDRTPSFITKFLRKLG